MTELLVGRVVAVEPHPGARAPSVLLTVDLGPHGLHRAPLPLPEGGDGSALVGAQILVGRDGDDVTVAGAHSHAHGLVVVRPDREVEDGTVVA